MSENSVLGKTVLGQAKIGLKPELEIVDPNKIHHLLEPGELGAVLELIVTDPKTGEITERRVLKSKSCVRQFLEMLIVSFKGASSVNPVSIRDISNTLRNIRFVSITNTNLGTWDTIAGVGIVNCGIIIGTGSTAPTINDYVIETIIPHATMNYGAVTYGLPASDATTSQFTITRNFSNVSGGVVTVNEVALYALAYDGSVRCIMIIRDIIAGGMPVPDGQILTVNYRIQAVI